MSTQYSVGRRVDAVGSLSLFGIAGAGMRDAMPVESLRRMQAEAAAAARSNILRDEEARLVKKELTASKEYSR